MFVDRQQGGQALARLLEPWRGADTLVLGLPRGGVPVAFEVARALGAPLDVYVVRKLGVPGHEELAMGAIATGGTRVLNAEVITYLGIADEVIEQATREERAELERREVRYRGNRPPPVVNGRTVIVVDDGLATGSTMRAAAASLRHGLPQRIVVGVPVAARQTVEELAAEVDDVVCVAMPEPFRAVGLWYEDFSQTTDEEVRALLDRAARARQEAG